MNTGNIDIIIVGAGASGLTAGIISASRGKRVLILEKEPFAGRKISVSGNGKCNITNRFASPDTYYGDKKFISSVLSRYGVNETCSFFEKMGLPLIEKEEGRIFPLCERAKAVQDILVRSARAAGAEIIAPTQAKEIKKTSDGFLMSCADKKYVSKKVVLACGSCAFPSAGGSASGYILAEKLGHKINKVYPSLVPLCVKQKGLQRLAGIRADVSLRVATDNHIFRGEILFTPYGISGPVVLNLSRIVCPLLERGSVRCSMNLFPQYGANELLNFLSARKKLLAGFAVKDFFTGLMHESIANLLIDILALDKKLSVSGMTDAMLKRISVALSNWEFDATDSRGEKEAAAMSGGVDCAQINPETMESRLIKDLYITGELLDVDGFCGGYNLHFAWVTGMIAGNAV